MKLSDTALIVLNGASQRDDRLVPRRAKAPPVVDVNVCRALVKQGLVELVRVPLDASDVVTVREDDCLMAFILSDAGFRAINLEPPAMTEADIEQEHDLLQEQIDAENAADEAATAPRGPTDAVVAPEGAAVTSAADAAPVAPQAATDAGAAQSGVAGTDAPVAASAGSPARTTLRQAAAAVLAAWDDELNLDADPLIALQAPMTSLRALLAEPAPRTAPGTPRKPREGTKQQAVLTMLRRTEGATVAQVMDATGWASHTVRGFFAGLKKKGFSVEALERVRLVGPDKQGAKGSYTVYHLATPAAG